MVINPEDPKQLIELLESAPLVLYGMGGAGIRIAKWCDNHNIKYIFSDQNADKKQNHMGVSVVSPSKLKEQYSSANFVISSIIYYDDIAQELLKQGIEEEHILSYKLFMSQNIVWSDLDDNIDWDLMRYRVEMFSEWITEDIYSVVDYGAGKMFLKEYLNSKVQYSPIDYIRRSEETILCDLNLGEFPKIQADATICSGVLEFIYTAELLLKHVCENTNKIVILSYVTIDKFHDINGRRTSAYVSDLSEKQIVDIMALHHFFLEKMVLDPINNACSVYMFKQRDKI